MILKFKLEYFNQSIQNNIFMKRNIRFVFTFIFVQFFVLNSAFAQITVDNSTFPIAGDTLRTSVDNLPSNIEIGSAGVDLSWDFSSLQSPFVDELLVQNAEEGQVADQFPTADVVTELLGGGEAYYSSDDNEYLLLGYNGPDPIGFGIDLLARLEPASVIKRAPMNFLDINTSGFNINIPFSAEAIPAEVFENLPIKPDSIRIRISSDRTDVVDAWGTLTIPGGTFEVLREKRIEYQETLLDIKIGEFPWQDVTALVPFPDLLGTDTIITYNYFSNDAKEPIVVATVSPDESVVETVTYKSIEVPTSITRPNVAKSDVIAYPNPAIDSARFQFSNLRSGNYDLKIYNILGIVVQQNSYQISGSKTVEMDLSDLRKGTYLYSLQNEEGQTLVTKRLLIIRP